MVSLASQNVLEGGSVAASAAAAVFCLPREPQFTRCHVSIVWLMDVLHFRDDDGLGDGSSISCVRVLCDVVLLPSFSMSIWGIQDVKLVMERIFARVLATAALLGLWNQN